jgi:hypothetical protein
MTQSETYRDKRADIAGWIEDMFEDLGCTREIKYNKAASDFIKYMTANGWDIVPYDEKNHRYYP